MRKELRHFALFVLAVCVLVLVSVLARWAHAQSVDRELHALWKESARVIIRTCGHELEILAIKGAHYTGKDWYDCLAHYAAEASVRHAEGEGYEMKAWPRSRLQQWSQ